MTRRSITRAAMCATVLNTAATLVMYYHERLLANEMMQVLAIMRDSISAMQIPGIDPHLILIEWGGLIKAKFDVDNLHLTSPSEHAAPAPVVQAVKGLGGTIAQLFQSVGKVFSKCGSIEDSLTKCLQNLQINPASTTTSTTAASASASASTSIPPAHESPAPPIPVSTPLVSPASVSSPAVQMAPMEVDGIALHATTDTGKEYKFAGLLASQFFLDCMMNGGNLPGRVSTQNISRGQLCLDWFKRMSTAEERGLLLSRPLNIGAAQKLVAHIAALVIDRLIIGYKGLSLEVPKILVKKDAVRSTVPPSPALHSTREASSLLGEIYSFRGPPPSLTLYFCLFA